MRKIYSPAILLLLAFVLTSIANPPRASALLPLITQQPTSVTVECTGESATFAVVATGENLSYQWYHYGDRIPGAVEPTYTNPSVGADDVGSYHVIVRGAGLPGVERSLDVELIINQAPRLIRWSQPTPNCGLTPATFSVTATGANLTYQWYRNTLPIPGATEREFTIDTVRSKDTSGYYRVVISGSCGMSLYRLFGLSLIEPVRLYGWSESKTRRPGAIVTYDVSFSIHATGSNLKYQWYRDKIPLSPIHQQRIITGDSIFINNATPADAGMYSVQVWNDCSNEMSGGMSLMIGYASGPADRSVCSGQLARFVAPDTTDDFTYQWRKDGVDIPGATSFFLEFPSARLEDQGLYTVAITLKTTSATIETPPGRLIVTQSAQLVTEPQSQVLCHGAPLRLAAEAVGDSLTYQWWKSGMMIPGATSPTYELPSAIPSNSGFYHVAVTGTCGVLLSEPAFVSVAARTSIDEQPVGRTVIAGESVTFFVTATGTDLKYQWRKNGVEMVSYEDPFITIAMATPDDQATYDVVITDDCGEVTLSDPAVLVVRIPASVAGEASIRENAAIVVTPHPASGTTQLEVRLPENQRLNERSVLSLYDMRGGHVLDIEVEPWDGSTVRGMFDASTLSAGLYLLYLRGDTTALPLGSIMVER